MGRFGDPDREWLLVFASCEAGEPSTLKDVKLAFPPVNYGVTVVDPSRLTATPFGAVTRKLDTGYKYRAPETLVSSILRNSFVESSHNSSGMVMGTFTPVARSRDAKSPTPSQAFGQGPLLSSATPFTPKINRPVDGTRQDSGVVSPICNSWSLGCIMAALYRSIPLFSSSDPRDIFSSPMTLPGSSIISTTQSPELLTLKAIFSLFGWPATNPGWRRLMVSSALGVHSLLPELLNFTNNESSPSGNAAHRADSSGGNDDTNQDSNTPPTQSTPAEIARRQQQIAHRLEGCMLMGHDAGPLPGSELSLLSKLLDVDFATRSQIADAFAGLFAKQEVDAPKPDPHASPALDSPTSGVSNGEFARPLPEEDDEF
eukprot:Selendium_serpulae@DN6393_c0_g1_i16.p2